MINFTKIFFNSTRYVSKRLIPSLHGYLFINYKKNYYSTNMINTAEQDKKEEKKEEVKQQKKNVPKNQDLAEKYNRKELENVLKRRFFVIPGFEIYGGVAGLYDYGPTGCALKNNIEAYWREHFILEENMLEISGTCLTPEIVLKASGHVDKFTDYAVKDLKTGTCYRADKLIQENLDKMMKKKNIKENELEELKKLYNQVDKFAEEELDKTISLFKIKAPDTASDLSPSFKLNLMFGTPIGPVGGIPGFLRPETAQGHFVNFRRLLEFNGGKVPFASASIGLGFRNEIAPRSGLLRVREFTMAEIEHYVDPDNKSHKKFKNVKHLKLPLWSAENADDERKVITEMTLEEAVNSKLIDNETLAYFMARTYIFLTTIGISKSGVRFRQHAKDEMAHYASDCWDAEVETSYGWIEVAGHADRTCFDLTNHTKFSGVELCASKPLPHPITKVTTRVALNKGNLYKNYKEHSKAIIERVEAMSESDKDELFKQLEANKGEFVTIQGNVDDVKLTKEFITVEKVETTHIEEKFVPGVIEPSFGIGRIVYCVLEHAFGIREKDAKRTFFAFPPIVAPYKVSIIPLIHNDEMLSFVEPIRKCLVQNGISHKIDDVSDSVGRRYARTDEIGVPFGITIDDQTVNDKKTVTLRELVTMKQIRIPYEEVGPVLRNIVNLVETWEEVLQRYPLFEHKVADK